MSEAAKTRRQTLAEVSASLWGKAGLVDVIQAIADGAQRVAQRVQSAAIEGTLGATGDINVQGEAVQHLDALGSDIFVETLINSGGVVAIGSEELDEAIIADTGNDVGFMVQMDPVDGSSNVDVAVSIGSIFGIWHNDMPGPISESALLRPGKEQVAAAYVVYGTSTMLVVAIEGNVQGFTLDSTTGDFLLTHPDIRIPERCEYYSANDGNFRKWDGSTQQAVAALQSRYSLRYVGSLVCDFHRNILKGGIYVYPADPTYPEGKLRLMYEANPLGYIAEQAGGAASTGAERILDIQPESPHQRTPLVIGNRDAVEDTVSLISS
ncbi:MAG: class 1 fructose-bisphosphatase [Candidatus Latescibacteria bacterium]|jgi:fructose-1,6-bisphosphatase I|nr:class 1 fructose-bisphosphatase [Candidatus Latescibacterota bacterium]